MCHAPYPLEFWTKYRYVIGNDTVELSLDSAKNRKVAGNFIREVIEIFHSPDRQITKEQVETIISNNYFLTVVCYSGDRDTLRDHLMNFRVVNASERRSRKEKLREALIDNIKYITDFCSRKLKDKSGRLTICEVKECACRIDTNSVRADTKPADTKPKVTQITFKGEMQTNTVLKSSVTGTFDLAPMDWSHTEQVRSPIGKLD
jgi:hypothetical protein